MPLCEPWVDAESVELCSDVTDSALLERATVVASNLLYALSGRQYTGICTDVVRPCQWADGCWAHVSWAGSDRPPRVGCHCRGPVACSVNHDALPLPHGPVVDVPEILVDGAVLAEDWVIVDDRWLVRRSPERWPRTQYLDRLADEADTWQVTYRYGTAVPADAVAAAEALACELAKAWDPGGGDCALPPGVTSVIAENVSYDLDQVGEDVQAALLGIREVAAFLAARNPNRLARRGRFIDPRKHRPRRMRRIRAASTAATPSVAVYSGGDAFGTGPDTYSGGDAFGTGDDTYLGGTA